MSKGEMFMLNIYKPTNAGTQRVTGNVKKTSTVKVVKTTGKGK